MTNYLRFSDQATWKAAAKAAGFRVKSSAPNAPNGDTVEAQWTWLYYTHDWSIDDVGILYNNDMVVDADGQVISPPTAMEGWHVNFIGTLPDGWDQYLVNPRNPRRVFA
jgi:hypothetical protein